MSFFSAFYTVSKLNEANFKSVVNIGDAIEIQWLGDVHSVLITEMAVELNNDYTFPTDFTIRFTLCFLDKDGNVTDETVTMTHTNFQYVKHIQYAPKKGN